MAFPRIRLRWRLRTLMIVVALAAVGLVIHRIYVERAPVYQLILQLRTGNAQARSQAAVQLGLMGPKASFAAAALTSALDDSDPAVRTEATYALVKIGSRSPRLLQALVAELEDPPMRRTRFMSGSGSPGHDPVAALKSLRPAAAVIMPMLAKPLKSPNPGVHGRAVDVLCAVAGWSGPSSPEVAEALLAVLAADRFDLRKPAAEALAKLDRGTQERAVARLLGDLRDLGSSRSFEASTLLPLLPDGTTTAVATLVDQARGGDEVRRLIALFLLGQYGELAAPAAPALMRIITERDADRRINLGLQMYWWKSFRARGGHDQFQRRFPNPNTPGETSAVALCVRALIAMGGAISQRAIGELLAVVRDPDADDDRKRGAIVGLGEFGHEAGEAIPALVEVIRTREKVDHGNVLDADDEGTMSFGAVATVALAEIGSAGTEEIVAILAGLLEAEDAKVRNHAAIALELLGPKAGPAIPALVKGLRSPDIVVRRWSAAALGKIGGPEVRAVMSELMAALDGEDRWVRTRAAEAIGPFGAEAKAAVPKIVRLLWEYGPNFGVAKSLGQIGPDAAAAVPILVVSRDGASPPTLEEVEAALGRIMPRTKGATIAGSIASLRKGAPDERVRAAYELGRLIEKPTDPAGIADERRGALVGAAALGEALGDPDPRVRRMAAAMLCRPGSSAAVAGSNLIRATRDPDDVVRRLAASALGRVAAKISPAVPALAEMMEDSSG
jgi:HEAT repeat protein